MPDTTPSSPTDAAADCATLRAAAAATRSPSDQIAYALDIVLISRPCRVSCDADYPGWVLPGGERP
ncbi:hypothetical protein [Streptomyces qinglanensis]|uniref:hypothetical protein n=1 Tax=Streptomyces qinglanensis TaxID=943816 RepID=UPI003D71950E